MERSTSRNSNHGFSVRNIIGIFNVICTSHSLIGVCDGVGVSCLLPASCWRSWQSDIGVQYGARMLRRDGWYCNCGVIYRAQQEKRQHKRLARPADFTSAIFCYGGTSRVAAQHLSSFSFMIRIVKSGQYSNME